MLTKNIWRKKCLKKKFGKKLEKNNWNAGSSTAFRNSVKTSLTRGPQQPIQKLRNSVKTSLTQGPQQPIQKFSKNVTHAGSSTAYSENSVKTSLTQGPHQPIQKFSKKRDQHRVLNSLFRNSVKNVTNTGSSTAYSEIQ